LQPHEASHDSTPPGFTAVSPIPGEIHAAAQFKAREATHMRSVVSMALGYARTRSPTSEAV